MSAGKKKASRRPGGTAHVGRPFWCRRRRRQRRGGRWRRRGWGHRRNGAARHRHVVPGRPCSLLQVAVARLALRAIVFPLPRLATMRGGTRGTAPGRASLARPLECRVGTRCVVVHVEFAGRRGCITRPKRRNNASSEQQCQHRLGNCSSATGTMPGRHCSNGHHCGGELQVCKRARH